MCMGPGAYCDSESVPCIPHQGDSAHFAWYHVFPIAGVEYDYFDYDYGYDYDYDYDYGYDYEAMRHIKWSNEGQVQKRIFRFSLRIFWVIHIGVGLDVGAAVYAGSGECRDSTSSHMFFGGQLTGGKWCCMRVCFSFWCCMLSTLAASRCRSTRQRHQSGQ